MIKVMTTNLMDAPLARGAVAVPWAGAHTTPRRRTGTVFLLFVAVVVALGVVAINEPAPGDIGIVLLVAQGFFVGNLRWDRTIALPAVLLSLFVVANLASFCYAVDPAQGAVFLLVTLFMLVTWVFTVGILTRFQERGLLVLMSAYTVGGVLSALCGIVAYAGMLPFGDSLLFYDRVKGLFKDPNVFGPYLVVVVVYSIYRLQASRGALGGKALWLCSCLISTLGILLSFSRAAWANFALTLIVFFVLNALANRAAGTLKRNLAYFLIALVLVGGAVVYAVRIPQVSQVVAYRSELQVYDEDRFATHEAALEMGMDNPVGVGPGQSFLLLDYATHSLYLRVFSENGVLGSFSLMAFVLLTFVRSLLLSKRAPQSFQRAMFALAAAAILGALLNSFAIDTLHWRHFWFLLALGWMPLWAGQADAHGDDAGGGVEAQSIKRSQATANPRQHALLNRRSIV